MCCNIHELLLHANGSFGPLYYESGPNSSVPLKLETMFQKVTCNVLHVGGHTAFKWLHYRPFWLQEKPASGLTEWREVGKLEVMKQKWGVEWVAKQAISSIVSLCCCRRAETKAYRLQARPDLLNLLKDGSSVPKGAGERKKGRRRRTRRRRTRRSEQQQQQPVSSTCDQYRKSRTPTPSLDAMPG